MDEVWSVAAWSGVLCVVTVWFKEITNGYGGCGSVTFMTPT